MFVEKKEKNNTKKRLPEFLRISYNPIIWLCSGIQKLTHIWNQIMAERISMPLMRK